MIMNLYSAETIEEYSKALYIKLKLMNIWIINKNFLKSLKAIKITMICYAIVKSKNSKLN